MAGKDTDMSSDWQVNGNNLTNTSIGMIPMGNSMIESSAPMVDSFRPPLWDHQINGHNLGYGDVNLQNATLKGGMFLQSGMLPPFPADSAFIERAARFSCFSGGNFGEMMNPFGISEPLNPYTRSLGPNEVFGGNGMQSQRHEINVSREVSILKEHGNEGNPFKNEKKSDQSFRHSSDEARHGVDVSGNGSDEAEFSGRGAQEELDGLPGDSFGKGFGSKKRKRTRQITTEHNEINEAQQPSAEKAMDTEEIKQKEDQIQIPNSISKAGGKQCKQGSQGSDPDQPKEDYIHIRARRGQATNSHSLAERVRREKISERMKYLQDLVPGCSKQVTGKAVMLDEIINYVQSLQRQVEFLSMKLATVNPRLDSNVEGYPPKDMLLQPRGGLSSSLAFPHDTSMPFAPLHHPPQLGSLSGLGNNTSETLRRLINLQSSAVCGGYKEPTTSQVPNAWEDELHNIVHMGFNSSSSALPPSSQDLSAASLRPGHMKTEP
ncbi:hypothetical protein RD792_015389 [Penstemon davidsonii]|uniref:BHLH domain-containing protein n=1 Tax=Penstemon davidsonii TaxID=160366 RepID=A0ABR0CTI2_9LAMI|nr:hypothetical protein RD792_015389 [Penstemon davidsonii]